MPVTVRIDDEGRLTIPERDREALGIKPGDTFLFEREGKVLRFAKAEDPFDVLAEHAIREHRKGRTKDLRQVAQERGIRLDAG
jgi:AbrB family looped-hinge helix DNA binding protein